MKMTEMMVLRSMLFVPGNNLRMIAKATTLAPDAVILDLEDAVPLSDKETARIFIRDSIKPVKSSGAYVFVRVNSFPTGLINKDLEFVIVDGLDGIMLPKAETRADIVKIKNLLWKAEKNSGLKERSLKIIPIIESTKGLLNVYEIASASRRIVAVAFGAGDYYRDLGLSIHSLSSEETELLYARSKIVNDSRAAGVPAIETPWHGLLTDKEGFQKQTELALRVGFKGKLAVHPTQIELINKTFSPSRDEIEYAEKVIKAFEEAQAKGLGATSFEGKMIDVMHYTQARELLNLAGIIAEKEKKRQGLSISLFDFFTKEEKP